MGILKSWMPYLLCAFVINGCANEGENKNEITTKAEAASGLKQFPLLTGVDSMQVLFFKKPYTDSIRYTRYFSQYATSDSVLINAIKKDLDQPFEIKDIRDSCLSDGKLYMLKNGEPVKTLYFAIDCSSCCYLYLIQDGRFYYFKLTEDLQQALKEAQQKLFNFLETP